MTLAELAKELNVSVATVSNAISGKGRMRSEKRQEILEAAIARGYDVTKAEGRQRKKVVHVIVEDTIIHYCAAITDGLCAAAAEMDLLPIIYNMNLYHYTDPLTPDPEITRKLFQRIMREIIPTTSGIVYVSEYPRDMTRILPVPGVPFVYAYCYSHGHSACVNYDDANGAYIATQHLVECGCKKIAMISGPVNSVPMTKRLAGYQRALVDNGLEYDPLLIRVGAWKDYNGYQNMKDLLKLHPDIDAVFCQSDHIAVGAMNAAKELGYRIPDDICFVGFDNLEFSQFSQPPLTTIVPPCTEIGQEAFRLLINLIDKKAGSDHGIKLPCRIEQRGSTRKITRV